MSNVIVQLHVATGCDSISAFYGHGKKSIKQQAMKSEDIYNLLKDVGSYLPITADIVTKLLHFTLKIVYNEHSCTSLGKARALKWLKMKRKSIQRLPPDDDSHMQRARRINYVSNYLLNYHSKEISSSPFCHGWILTKGKCYPIRHTEPSLPSKLADILSIENCSTNNSETTESNDFESEETGRESNLYDSANEIFRDSDDESDIEETLEQSDIESEDDDY